MSEYNGLIERLKAQASFYDDLHEWDAPSGALDREAASAIIALQAENERLRASPPKPQERVVEALREARTLVISYRAHEAGKRGNRREYCQQVLDQIDAALAGQVSPVSGGEE